MEENSHRFEIHLPGDSAVDPTRAYMIHRTEGRAGDGPLLLVSNLRTAAMAEVRWSDLPTASLRDIILDGAPVARVGLATGGNVMGEWLLPETRPASDTSVHSTVVEAPVRRAPPGGQSESPDREAAAAALAQRIARCRAKIQVAAGDQQGTAEFEKRIGGFCTAAGRSEADAGAQAAAIRAYIEAVPALLERLLQSALDPDAPDIWAGRWMALLDATLDAFESAAVVPDQFGLSGLLDNAYIAARLLPEEIQVEVNHDQAIQLLGPFTILQLDKQVSEIQATLGADLPPNTGVAAAAASMPDAAAHGLCSECRHVRCGSPAAQVVFDTLLDAVRASARQAYSQKLRDEREMSRHFIDELEALKRSGDIYFTRRPTERRMTYCGVQELDGVHMCCEVKNLDELCDQFEARPADLPERACSTCRHNHRIPATLFHNLQRVAGHISTGRTIRDEIKKMIETQAQSEYEECVEYGGFVQSGRPGTLPYCEALSGAVPSGGSRYVVGPAVNVANQCGRWEPGDNETVSRLAATLAALDADAQRAWQDLANPPVLDTSVSSYSNQMREAAVNADADVIEFGLNALGVYPSNVEALCIGYVSDVGQTDIVRTPRAARAQSDGNAGYRAKEVPFVLEPNKIYRHPEQYRVTAQCQPDRGIIDVRDDNNTPYPFQISAFPPDTWQALAGPDGQRLRAVLMVSRGTNGDVTVHAAWL